MQNEKRMLQEAVDTLSIMDVVVVQLLDQVVVHLNLIKGKQGRFLVTYLVNVLTLFWTFRAIAVGPTLKMRLNVVCATFDGHRTFQTICDA